MIKGIMVHEQLADYYDFLGLYGYKCCHEHHFIEESLNFRDFSCYYINHFNRLVTETYPNNPKVIPESWYRYTRHDVDPSTRKTAVKTGITTWIEWEESTKDLYEEFISELYTVGTASDIHKFTELLTCVDKELTAATEELLKLRSVEFDMGYIVSEQECLLHKYSKKSKHKA